MFYLISSGKFRSISFCEISIIDSKMKFVNENFDHFRENFRKNLKIFRTCVENSIFLTKIFEKKKNVGNLDSLNIYKIHTSPQELFDLKSKKRTNAC